MRILILPVVIAVLALAGCGIDYDDLAKHRLEYAKGGRGDIYVAAIEESWSASYLDGIRLAIDQVNARPGKLLGRNVRLLVKEGVPNFDDSLPNILKIAKNPKVTAVLGHRRSVVAVPEVIMGSLSNMHHALGNICDDRGGRWQLPCAPSVEHGLSEGVPLDEDGVEDAVGHGEW